VNSVCFEYSPDQTTIIPRITRQLWQLSGETRVVSNKGGEPRVAKSEESVEMRRSHTCLASMART
jgi:hypothetical protein